jgi:AcrR family transcriptional regulator
VGLAANVEGRIKRSVIEAFAEQGLSGLTVDLICARADVSHSAFRTHWSDACDALLEALDEKTRLPELPDTGHLIDDLVAYAQAYLELYQDPVFTAFMFQLIGSAGVDAEFARRLDPGFMARRAVNNLLIERAIKRGELAAGRDPEPILNGVLLMVLSWAGVGRTPSREEMSSAFEPLIAAGKIH